MDDGRRLPETAPMSRARRSHQGASAMGEVPPAASGDEPVIAGLLVASQVALLQLMRVTSTTHDGDPFDSPLYWWSWLLFAATAFLASYARPAWRPWRWTAVLIVPLIVEVALLGTVWHDPDDGASFWLAGEMLVFVQGLLTLAAAGVGALLRLRPRRV